MNARVIPIVATSSPAAAHTVEGIARVVAIDGDAAWLEPEQTTSCGHCTAAAACGDKSLGGLAGRLEARRFAVDNALGLAVGERVVVGVADSALVKAALTAYALPLVAALVAGGVAQTLWASDAATMATMAAGLAAGLLAARLAATRLKARGQLAPRVLRRAGTGETCHTN